MSESTNEELLGYVLGALEDGEEESLRERLRVDPELRQALVLARQSLRRLEAVSDDMPPPPGLAARTCQYVATWVETHRGIEGPVTTLAPLSSAAAVSGNYRWPDLAVSTSVCLVALALVFPTVLSSRFEAQITACQDNLRVVGHALHDYSRRHDGYFPAVPAEGRFAAAGIYAPTLLRSGCLSQSRAVLCPGARPADADGFHVPSLDELQEAPDDRLPQLHTAMGGSYGYSLGHVRNGRYEATRNRSRPRFALVADAPSDRDDRQSLNHAGRGQNVLFEDGHVAFLNASRGDQLPDDIFVNDAGQVDAGLHEDDAVIAPSRARPVTLVPVSAGR